MLFCSNCGKSIQGAAFCPNCGASTSQALPQPADSPRLTTFPETSNFQVESPQPKKNKTGVVAIAALGALGLVAAGAFLLNSGPTPLQEAYDTCFPNPTFGDGVSIDDDGKGMFIDMEGEEEFIGAGYFDIVCVLAILDVPPSVQSQIDNTSSLMGVQSATWDGITASWTYHPDRGLDINFRID